MKVLLFDTTNAFLTPGGKTTHALKLQQELSKLGVEVEFVRWWDESQSDCDIIHFLATNTSVAKLAQARGKKTVLNLIFDFESSKSGKEQLKAKLKNKLAGIIPFVTDRAYWHSFPYFNKIIFMHEYDRQAALRYFPQLSISNTLIIPHAYDPADMYLLNHLNITEINLPTKYLISCAHISQRKQSILLAQYAKQAQVPIVFIGGGTATDKYFQAFQKEIDNRYVYYPGYVSKEWKDCIEQNAAGFVLLSQGESGCISVYEAAAYKLPIMLSNLPWAWGYENPTDIKFCDLYNDKAAIQQIKTFYDQSKKLDHYPFKIHTWQEIAEKYLNLYKELINK
ncbi:MAG: hypothetical protein EZS26_000284 [Candidatus Ordinivivax streblomastigis]|uniref:Glycosyl transferase family 1 domain-containing protein n=1 Tax=Candidatus Ordinivivax streblomastigis TaxID=2540710 RepID=A0A5M8P5K6_9BACT|nr:MAG: hypothetical protein EZS26_000284 [Candidatus Ordinivivax streblomastigis]